MAHNYCAPTLREGFHLARHHRQDMPACSFCEKTHDRVDKLIAGPDVNICNECVRSFLDRAQEPAAQDKEPCSFCGKKAREVQWMAQSESRQFRVCNECLKLCAEIVAEDRARKEGIPPVVVRCSFCGREETSARFKGPVVICDGCVNLCEDVAAKGKPEVPHIAGEDAQCSFCGKQCDCARVVVASADGKANICSLCLALLRQHQAQFDADFPAREQIFARWRCVLGFARTFSLFLA